MSVEFALLRNQVLDYFDSEDRFQALLGQLLHEQTDALEGEDFSTAVRELLDGLWRAIDGFDQEWEIIN